MVGIIIALSALQVRGTDYKTSDGTCIRDYIDVTDLVDAHVKALEHARPSKVGIYNVGTGKGKVNVIYMFYCNSKSKYFLVRHPNVVLSLYVGVYYQVVL